jgi:hypothetical protein
MAFHSCSIVLRMYVRADDRLAVIQHQYDLDSVSILVLESLKKDTLY